MGKDTSKTSWSIKIIIAAVLVLTYVAVLYLAVNPRVTNEYRLYYIEKSINRWPGQSGYDIEVGEPVVFNEDSNDLKKIDKGRGEATEEGVNIDPGYAVIYLDSIPAGEYDVTLTFAPSEIKDRIGITVTGCDDTEEFFTVSDQDTVVTVPITVSDIPEDNVIEISFSSVSEEDILLKEVVVDEA